jgi:uncharacterized protein YfdQ (DUF2303 family)
MKAYIFLVFVLILPQLVWAEEHVEPAKTVEQTGFIGTDYISTKSVTKGDQTVTTGYIENHAIRLKTKETASGAVTTGWVDGKYVRIKEKPTDRKD